MNSDGCAGTVFLVLVLGFGAFLCVERGWDMGYAAGVSRTRCEAGLVDSCTQCIKDGSDADQKACAAKLTSLADRGDK